MIIYSRLLLRSIIFSFSIFSDSLEFSISMLSGIILFEFNNIFFGIKLSLSLVLLLMIIFWFSNSFLISSSLLFSLSLILDDFSMVFLAMKLLSDFFKLTTSSLVLVWLIIIICLLLLYSLFTLFLLLLLFFVFSVFAQIKFLLLLINFLFTFFSCKVLLKFCNFWILSKRSAFFISSSSSFFFFCSSWYDKTISLHFFLNSLFFDFFNSFLFLDSSIWFKAFFSASFKLLILKLLYSKWTEGLGTDFG